MNTDSISLEQQSTPVSTKSFGIRAAAFLIDSAAFYLESMVVTVVMGIILGLILASTGQEFQRDQFSSSQWLDGIFTVVTSTLYFVIFEGLYGATPGKLILGMRVVKESGESCNFGAAIIRGVLRLIDGLFLGLPAYFAMKNPLSQRIGDKAAKTIVVSSKDPIIEEHIDWWWFLIAVGVYTAADFVVTLFLVIAAMP